MQFQDGKKLTKSLENYIPNKIAYNQYFEVGVKSKPVHSISDVLFSTQYYSNDILESDKIAKKINTAFKKKEV